jgi:hypothetical protein
MVIASVLIQSDGVSAACEIEKWPPATLANYIRESTTQAQAIVSKYQNICGANTSPMTAYKTSLSTLDKAGNQLPIMNNMITDFTYNILALFRDDTSPLVLSHGELLYNLEKNVLLGALDQLAAKCQLDWPAEAEIVALISRNNSVQDFFKSVAIGNVWEGKDALEKAILDNYRKEAIANCSNKVDLSTMIEKATKAIEGFGTDITIARQNWDEAMALISGTSKNKKKSYNELQAELLKAELQRQWLSQGAIQQMITNLECSNAESDGSMSIEDQARSVEKCRRRYIIGYEKVIAELEALRWKAPDTDTFITLTQKTSKQITEEKTTLSLYNELLTKWVSGNDEEAITNTMITNLVNMHASLVGVNALLEKRIPIMQKNCMKGSPDIVGGCY